MARTPAPKTRRHRPSLFAATLSAAVCTAGFTLLLSPVEAGAAGPAFTAAGLAEQRLLMGLLMTGFVLMAAGCVVMLRRDIEQFRSAAVGARRRTRR